MRNYELLLIIRATLDDAGVNGVVEAVAELIEAHNGDVLATKAWGRRKLAYPINKQAEGVYFLIRTAISPAALQEIEFSLKLNENLLRYMLVKELIKVEEPAAEPEQASDEAPASDDAAPAEVVDDTEPSVAEESASTDSAD